MADPDDAEPQADESVRTVRAPATGTKLFLVGALLLVVYAVYLLLVPVSVPAKDGQSFDCGSVISGPSSNFAKGVCGSATDKNATRAYAVLGAAVVVAVGGFVTFGMVERRQSSRRDRDTTV